MHSEQVLLCVLGRHAHCPPLELHCELAEPRASQAHECVQPFSRKSSSFNAKKPMTQSAHAPAASTLALHRQAPVVWSHDVGTPEALEPQLQGEQPSALEESRRTKPGAHSLQRRPVTCVLQLHWPSMTSHTSGSPSVPALLHAHAVQPLELLASSSKYPVTHLKKCYGVLYDVIFAFAIVCITRTCRNGFLSRAVYTDIFRL